MRLFLPSDAPTWLKAFASSVEDKFRSIMTAPFRLLGLATAELPAPSDYAQGLVYDLTSSRILYSTGAAWNRLFGSGDAALEAIAVLTPAADRYIYFTGPTSAALGTATAFGRSLLDDPDAAAGRSTLGAEAAIAAGTAGQYWRGDKSWQTLNAAAVAFAPAGSISAGTVQAAIAELDVEKQPLDSELSAIAGLASAADRLPYFTGVGTAALAAFTAAGRALVDDADAAAQRTTLGLGTAATRNTGTTGAVVPLLSGAATIWASGMTISSGGLTLASGSLSATVGTTTGHALASQGRVLTLNSTNSNNLKIELQNGGATAGYLGASASGPVLATGDATSRVQVSTAGIDVTGEARCDTLRIDATPTAAAVAQTHHVPISINGTTYKLLLAS